MKVLILAAGRSKRMNPIKDKNFLNFLGKPLIKWQLEMLKEAGLDDVILVGGKHNLDDLIDLTQTLKMDIEVVEQKDLNKGMCGAILAAKDKINKEEVLIFSSNDVVDKSAFELIQDAAARGDADSYILGKKVVEYFPGGYLEVNEKGLIRRIVEKPAPGTEPGDMVNLVIHLHKNSEGLITALESVKSKKDDLYEVALDNLIKSGMKMKAVSYEGFWQPIKYPWHIHKIFRYLFDKSNKGIGRFTDIADDATIKGEVIIGNYVRIFEGAVVNGPVYVGDYSVIANNALVRNCHIGQDCVIGYCSEIARSYLGNDVWSHTNYIGDSVIGNNVSFGAGSVTGNLRLDEYNVLFKYGNEKIDTGLKKFGLVCGDNVRIGVNTSFMPGVKIGSDSFIGAGVVIGKDVPENSYARGKFELKISKNRSTADKSDREELKKKL
ncbi:NTP transferase domain-containing protein [Candidatus Peregrinibacteria bacterium]|nr:NTP transferase domain-containing protein [Candidatus Peregrinibacteria bacterium]